MRDTYLEVSQSNKLNLANAVRKLINAKGLTLHEASSAIGLKYQHLVDFFLQGINEFKKLVIASELDTKAAEKG